MVTEEDLDVGSIYPSLSRVTECSVKIATKLVEYAYKKGLSPYISNKFGFKITKHFQEMPQYSQNLRIKKLLYVPKCTILTTFQQYLAYIHIQNCNN